ncbi:hypothetical protein JCM15831A_24600 [Asaia astilbis]
MGSFKPDAWKDHIEQAACLSGEDLAGAVFIRVRSVTDEHQLGAGYDAGSDTCGRCAGEGAIRERFHAPGYGCLGIDRTGT